MLNHIFSSKASDGVLSLKQHMGIKKIKVEESKFKGKPEKTVINWGSTKLPPEVLKCNVLNLPDKIALASNKLTFFNRVKQVYPEIIPPFTENVQDAITWLKEGYTIVCRTILNGSGGAGIVLVDKDTEPFKIPKAPLYVQYVPKKEEYRIHVIKNNVIDFQRKVRSTRSDIPVSETNFKIRNLENGFIYQRENVNPNESVFDVAKKAIEVSGLDFGAVDVIFGSKSKVPYVLEINTAPGLQGMTIENYAKAFKDYF